jgi:DNA (cytosine-5)-methyltransferase 1
MSGPWLLDAYCCAGGATRGYQRAGFRVTGVDLQPQPHYCGGEFIQADVLDLLADRSFLAQFDAVHASPPCQSDSQMSNCRRGLAEQYPQLIGPTRDALTAWGGPWVIENVDGADVARQDNLFGANGLLLCGFMFGLRLYRHRLFESNFPLPGLHHPRHSIAASKAGHWEPGTIISVSGNCAPVAEARAAMGIDWMPRDYLREAIPPAYSEYIGLQLMAALRAAA